MTGATPLVKTNLRDIDPNVLQGRASSPETSSWVSASAGSGKTKVLTERILRLLLPNKDGKNQTPCYKILALTFTKAAASEMALRIQKKLKSWTILEANKLTIELSKLLERPANNTDIEAARRLFAEITDSPSGLNIMTIHSFCQSVLSRFPLESGISPQFKPLEENEAKALLSKAHIILSDQAQIENNETLLSALSHLSEQLNEDQFSEILNSICAERYQLHKILEKYFGADGIYANICRFFEIDPAKNLENIVFEFCDLSQNLEEILYKTSKALSEGGKTDQARGIAIQSWLEKDPKERAQNFETYKKHFLTEDKETKRLKPKKLYTKKILECFPEEALILDQEAMRLIDCHETILAHQCASLTRYLMVLSENLLEKYENEKEKISALDFDDMILKTLDLLKGKSMSMSQEDMSPWVRFKLDQGIDHILVDEAQDTNPEQWEIIESLAYDFFDGQAATETERTIFVVGDEKQSIFSFQRASPEKFNTMRNYFSEKIKNAKSKFDPIDINISFRSVSCILELVDSVFAPTDMKSGLGFNVLDHSAFRRGQPGLVELWPAFESPDMPEIDYWEPPIEVQDAQSSAVNLANHIAQTIKQWIENKETLESHNRPIEASDIMILMRSRNAFVNQLVKSLKFNNIPVSGVDRMVLTDEIVVEDILSALQFAVLPDDDLNLACLLKSPFIGFDEESLFKISYNRSSSLWESLKSHNQFNGTIKWLESLVSESGKAAPYSFIDNLLQKSCPTSHSGLKAIKTRLGDESVDPIEELLNKALDFEANEAISLQGFIQSIQSENTVVKREMEEAGKAVRIMTVHGSKGLQAPIVILPDTFRSSSSIMNDKIIWPDRSGHDYPYFIPRQKEAPLKSLDAITNIKNRSENEYKRLLYVAMTRAENRLYIGGYKNNKKPLDNSWYNFIKNGFENLKGVEDIHSGNFDEPIKRYTTENTAKEADRSETKIKAILNHKITTPEWLFKKMPEEPSPPRPLVPSRPSESEMSVSSPLQNDNNERFKRGNITHMLLQTLPEIPRELWEKKAKQYTAQPSHNITTKVQASIVEETLKVLNHPDFGPIFDKGSVAEAPVTGMLDNKTLISGQIDRLLITDTDIYIIDFKTNRPPPTDEDSVPLLYKNQLKAYAKALLEIYPDKTIHTALLWTEEPRLMPLKVL